MTKIMLSSRGIRSLFYGDTSDFTFVLQNHEEVKCKTIVADFISPIIANNHQNDITYNRFEFSIDGNPIEGITKNHIEQLINLASGESIDLSKSDIVIMKIISVLLGNEELLNLLEESRSSSTNSKKQLNLQGLIFMSDEFTESNILKVLKFYELRGVLSNKAIEYAAKNFEKVDKNQLKKLNQHTLLSIVSNQKLVLENEDSLLNFIFTLYENETSNYFLKESIAELFEAVSFENLSSTGFQKFINLFDPSSMTTSLLRKISYSFDHKHENQNEQNFELTNESLGRFHGIIYYLTTQCGGNVHEKGVVEIKGTSIRNDLSLQPQVAADLFDLQSCFHSRNELNSTLTYDFKNFRVVPQSYSIRTNPWGGKGHYHLMSWVLEASNDEINWVTLDKKIEDKSLDMINSENNFKCNRIAKDDDDNAMSFRFIRIRNIGQNSGSNQILNNVMNIGAIEFFGKLISTSSYRYL